MTVLNSKRMNRFHVLIKKFKIGVHASRILALFALTGCGTGGNAIDPLQLMADSIPNLQNMQTGSWAGNTITAPFFTSATPYWTFLTTGFSIFLSPANGYVSEVGGGAIKIIHSGRFATRMVGLGLINVRSGDYVFSGQNIGTFATTGSITFQVLLDGSPVCPLSFMSTTFRQSFIAITGFNNQICQ
jgi:hypothetical protein